jgi:Protein of unknown function (DUF3040)
MMWRNPLGSGMVKTVGELRMRSGRSDFGMDRVSRWAPPTYSVPIAEVPQEVVVPLSDNEQRLLEQMERALYAEDPKFASTMRGAARRSGSARRMMIGVGAVVLGLVLLIVGVVQQAVPLSVAGFISMLAGTAYAVSGHRRGGPAGVVQGNGAVRKVAKRRTTFMQRLEQRWDRRRDGR